MHKFRLCLRPNGLAELVDRGPSMEEIEKRGPRNKQEAANLAAWQKAQKPQFRPRGRPYRSKR